MGLCLPHDKYLFGSSLFAFYYICSWREEWKERKKREWRTANSGCDVSNVCGVWIRLYTIWSARYGFRFCPKKTHINFLLWTHWIIHVFIYRCRYNTHDTRAHTQEGAREDNYVGLVYTVYGVWPRKCREANSQGVSVSHRKKRRADFICIHVSYVYGGRIRCTAIRT